MPNPSLDLQNIGDLYIRNNFSKLNDFFEGQGQLLDFKFYDVTFLRAGERKLFHGLKRVPNDLVKLSMTGNGIVTFRRSDFDGDYLVLSSTGPCRVRFLAGSYFRSTDVINYGDDETESWFSSPTLDSILEASQSSASALGFIPSGAGILWFSSVIPDGYIDSLGQVVNRDDYPDIFAAMGTTYNTGGESSSQFRLPPAPGRSPLFAGTGSGLTTRTLGETLGEESHVLTLAELASHNHGALTGNSDAGAHTHDFSTRQFTSNSNIPAGGATNRIISTSQAGSSAQTNTTTQGSVNLHNHGIGFSGSDSAHNTIHPVFVCKLIIKI